MPRVARGGRRTNLALLGLIVAAAVTGAVAFAVGGPWVTWAVIAHGIAGLGIVALVPWKSTIAARGVRRHGSGSISSIILAVLVAIVLVTGVGHATGLAVSLGPMSAMQLHVGAALAAVPLVVWHVMARRTMPRRTDLSRRNVVRAGVVVAASAAAYAALEAVVHVAGFPGAARRRTGSYERGSDDPSRMPVTQWLDDRVPELDPDRWTVSIADADGERVIDHRRLMTGGDRVRAVLDCTGGWWAAQDWEGVFLGDLLAGMDGASSVVVTSITGYGRRLPATGAGGLLLATRMGGEPLSSGHGSPVRLVAPGRRGFWWVKWVERIELSGTPWWWQAPFPVT